LAGLLLPGVSAHHFSGLNFTHGVLRDLLFQRSCHHDSTPISFSSKGFVARDSHVQGMHIYCKSGAGGVAQGFILAAVALASVDESKRFRCFLNFVFPVKIPFNS
jgi:hypothetical protein